MFILFLTTLGNFFLFICVCVINFISSSILSLFFFASSTVYHDSYVFVFVCLLVPAEIVCSQGAVQKWRHHGGVKMDPKWWRWWREAPHARGKFCAFFGIFWSFNDFYELTDDDDFWWWWGSEKGVNMMTMMTGVWKVTFHDGVIFGQSL